ncbi:hypothetical protein [Oceaniradius stylonematis]|uniref:hypothetical protein n=1 Tax=Oceaniradius stylonematis TaxID=2184161 RepID=UPI00273EA80A|nr:hypothetical protein [Oceaniradius stylonematis]
MDKPQFPVGTAFKTRGKHPRLCTVTDYHVTRNLAGEIVKAEYVATFELIGQKVKGLYPRTTVAMGVVQKAEG